MEWLSCGNYGILVDFSRNFLIACGVTRRFGNWMTAWQDNLIEVVCFMSIWVDVRLEISSKIGGFDLWFCRHWKQVTENVEWIIPQHNSTNDINQLKIQSILTKSTYCLFAYCYTKIPLFCKINRGFSIKLIFLFHLFHAVCFNSFFVCFWECVTMCNNF